MTTMFSASNFHLVHPPVPANGASNSHTVVPVAATKPLEPVAVANNQLVFRNPSLGMLLWNQPKPRNAFALPTLISPTAAPNDQTLFEEPQPGGPQHYLPSYALATTGSGNQTQFAVSLAPSSAGYLLTVKLADVT
ncbi:MAG: hypothetical protein WBP85_08850, partial [Terracidiphilus sp.]